MTNIENVLKNFKSKNYIEALEELDEILIIDPSSVEKLNLKGVILQLLDRPIEARQNWIKASNINDKYYDPYFNLGNSFLDENNYDDAEMNEICTRTESSPVLVLVCTITRTRYRY